MSAKNPVDGAESNASKLVMAVMRLLSAVVRARWERSESMETRVEDITPVS